MCQRPTSTKHRSSLLADSRDSRDLCISPSSSLSGFFKVSAIMAQGKALCRGRGRGRWKDVAGGGGTNALPLTNLAANGGHATHLDTPDTPSDKHRNLSPIHDTLIHPCEHCNLCAKPAQIHLDTLSLSE